MSDPDATKRRQALHDELNRQTAQIRWQELQPHYARGSVVVAEPGLDLLTAAVALAEDDRAQVAAWLDSQLLHRASEDEARNWSRENPLFWAVVVAPWVVIQAVVTD
ncbi:MAG TPA: DUF2288 family protein [Gammaproteobacteria bacterium]|nr:DUF2288 family protein [Gammaproteobacteria bacterium]